MYSDYGILAVCYEGDEFNRRIYETRVLAYNGKPTELDGKKMRTKPGQVVYMLRTEVFDRLVGGETFVTLPPDKTTGAPKRGAKVHPVRRDSGNFISTDPDERKADNLAELPEYEFGARS